MSHSTKLIEPKEGAAGTSDLQPVGQATTWRLKGEEVVLQEWALNLRDLRSDAMTSSPGTQCQNWTVGHPAGVGEPVGVGTHSPPYTQTNPKGYQNPYTEFVHFI